MTYHLQWQSQRNCIFNHTQITEAKILRGSERHFNFASILKDGSDIQSFPAVHVVKEGPLPVRKVQNIRGFLYYACTIDYTVISFKSPNSKKSIGALTTVSLKTLLTTTPSIGNYFCCRKFCVFAKY